VSQPEIKFVELADLLRIHRIAMIDQGSDPAVRDMGLLESAMAVPRQQFGGNYLHPDIPSMAAAYAFHTCRNHPFVDGNKRAATAAMLMFLVDNGWEFVATTDEGELAVVGLAAGELTKEQWTAWVLAHARQR
jgi:death on curing protein